MDGNTIYGYGYASCSVYDTRTVGSQVREDLAWGQPDAKVAEASWEGYANYHSRTASRTMVYRDDGDTQEYYTRLSTYDSQYGSHRADSGQLATHWAWR